MTIHYTIDIAKTSTSETQSLVPNSATSGVPYISQGTASSGTFGTALVAGGGTGSTSFNTTGVVISGATSTTALSSITLVAGQLAIGSSAGNPAAATISAGTGITVTNGNNSITIAASGGGLTWTDVTGTTQDLAVNNGYLADNSGLVTLTLPVTAAFGTVISVGGFGSGGWKIAQNSGQTIQFGSAASTTSGATGFLASTNRYDCVQILCVTANTVWLVLHSVGNLTIN